MNNKHYIRFFLMILLSFVSMFVLMYAMVDTFSNVYFSLTKFYMAGLMTLPMVIIELVLMGAMYPNKKWNALIMGASFLGLLLLWIFIRQQTAVTDKQFLRSMIPHHAAAILMCEKAPIRDPEIKTLCQNIISGQQSEINQMKAKLSSMGK